MSTNALVQSPWTHAAIGSDASAAVLPKPEQTNMVKVGLGFRAEMEVLYFEVRGCVYESEFKRGLVKCKSNVCVQ